MKIRCVYIDSINKVEQTFVVKEMRKYFKEKEKDLHEINGIDEKKLELQNILLQDNPNSLILKENSILSSFDSHIKEGAGVMSLESSFDELLRKERDINQKYGTVHFFLLPESPFLIQEWSIHNRCNFFKNINSYSVSQGLKIEIIICNEDDKIYDIRDKILKILADKYTI